VSKIYEIYGIEAHKKRSGLAERGEMDSAISSLKWSRHSSAVSEATATQSGGPPTRKLEHGKDVASSIYCIWCYCVKYNAAKSQTNLP